MKPTESLNRRNLSLATIAAAAAPSLVWAQSTTPIKLMVGFPPGGGTDAVARLLAERLAVELARPVVVENKAGAGGQLAAQALKAATPDGSTLFLSHDHTVSILPQVIKTPGYETADLQAVAGFATFVNAFAVSAGTPAKTMAEYVAWIEGGGDKGGKGKGAVGVPAPASIPEFVVKLLAERYKLDLVPAAYRGSAPMIADMLGNQIAAGTGSVPDFLEQQRAGKLRVIAVLGKERQTALPDVPTLAELGVSGFEDVPYYGVFAPKGTPQAFTDAFSAALAKIVAQPATREAFAKMGLTPTPMNATQLAERVRAYTATWAQIIKAKGFAPA